MWYVPKTLQPVVLIGAFTLYPDIVILNQNLGTHEPNHKNRGKTLYTTPKNLKRYVLVQFFLLLYKM